MRPDPRAAATFKGTFILARLVGWIVIEVAAEAVAREAGHVREVAAERADWADKELDQVTGMA